jgi:hypothetical protein
MYNGQPGPPPQQPLYPQQPYPGQQPQQPLMPYAPQPPGVPDSGVVTTQPQPQIMSTTMNQPLPAEKETLSTTQVGPDARGPRPWRRKGCCAPCCTPCDRCLGRDFQYSLGACFNCEACIATTLCCCCQLASARHMVSAVWRVTLFVWKKF